MGVVKIKKLENIFFYPIPKRLNLQVLEEKEMLFLLRFFPRKLGKKEVSNPMILKSKDFTLDIPLII